MAERLGNYQLVRLLGRGGFAEVYLGEHLRLGTYAAVKVLYTRLANPGDIEGFEKEARTIAHLKHPHIVRVLDYDVEDDIPFLVMDYAPGGTVRKRHPKGTILPLTTIISYVKQIADALQYAHDQRIIHRDIKPENMLVGEHDELLLSDFGIAIAAQSSRYQGTQNMGGTMAYIAPEQIQGHPRTASDQYSLGVVIYEWLSGGCPFHGSMTEIVAQHLAVPPPLLHEKVPTISPDIEQVVMTALAKDPMSRFGSVHAFANALEQAWQREQAHGPAPAVLWTPTRETPSSGLAPTLPVQISPTSPDEPSVSPSARPVALSKPSVAKSGASRGRIIQLIGVVLLVMIGSFGLFSTINGLRADHSTQSTTIAQTNLTATAQAYAIARSQANATATAHAAATATITAQNPDPYFPPGILALYDPLSNNSRGYRWDENGMKTIPLYGDGCEFMGGVYHAKRTTPNYLTWCVAGATDFSNFAFEVQMTIIKGGAGGIIFRADSATGKWYELDISQSGQYSLIRFDRFGAPAKTLASGSASALKTGLNQNNLIAALANGSTFDLFVNHQKIASVSDNTYSHGEIGVLADYSPAEVVYSNARVWAL